MSAARGLGSIRHAKRLLLAGVCASLLGCASFPEEFDVLPTSDEVNVEVEKKWASLPAIKYVQANTGASVRKRKPLSAELAHTPITFRLGGKSTIKEFVSALGTQGIRVVLKASEEKSAEIMQIISFDGKLGEILEMLALTHDLDFEYMNGVILLREGVRYMVTVPQNKELLDRIPKALEALGAKNVKTDIDSGIVAYDAAAGINEDVDLYLERMARNASMVTLQVAVIDLRLNRDLGSGFDWNEFSAQWGTGIGASGSVGMGTGGSGTGNGMGTGGTGTTGTGSTGSGIGTGTGAGQSPLGIGRRLGVQQALDLGQAVGGVLFTRLHLQG